MNFRWKYINNVPDTDTWKLLDQLHRIYSDAYHLAPHYNTLKLLMKSTQPIYAYEFIETGNIDYKGKISNTSGLF